MPDLQERVAFERRRARPIPANTSVPHTYDLLRSHLHTLERGRLLVESDLVRELSSSRNAVRAALQRLADDGLVHRKTKVGTTALGLALLPLNDLLTDQEKAVACRIHSGVRTSIIPVPEMLRTWLALAPGSSVAVIDVVLYHDDEPIGTSVGYVGLTPEEAVRFPRRALGTVSLLEEVLEVPIGRSESRVAAFSCDAETAALLGIEEGAAMLWTEDLIRDVDGRPRAIKQARFRGDRVALSSFATGRPGADQPAGAPR